jgi:hypothetical protein
MAKHRQQQAADEQAAADPLSAERRAYVESGGATEAPAATEQHTGPRPKRARREIPPEYRPYYVVFGQPVDGGPLRRIGRWKTKLRAERWIGESEELLKAAYSACEVVACKRKSFINLR